MNKVLAVAVAAALGLSLTSCNLGSPESTGKYDLDGSSEQLSSSAYNKLSPLQQYQVANKLTSALFKGVPAGTFFKTGTITANTGTLAVDDGSRDYLGKVKVALESPLPATGNANSMDSIVTKIEGDSLNDIAPRYTFDETDRPLQYPLAYLYEMPLSDEFFARWMAYKLVNTILFSPAEEIDSADELDVQTIYENLVLALKQDASVRSIILAHEKSEANWRRFRSPEDNTREMIEIYLGLFDRDADVPKASRACRNWSLSDEDMGYKLMKGPNVNTEPQLILDRYYVTTCEDFFEAVANHPLVIPRITTVLIDHMFGVDYDSARRAALARDIADSQPETFKDIFTAILFSKEFLLNMERPKWFEETYFNTAQRLSWRPYMAFFRDINGTSSNNNIQASLPLMYQPSFSLKLGRWPMVPTDVLASSYQHNGLRSVFLDRSTDANNLNDAGWAPAFTDPTTTMALSDFINYMFISVLGRAATDAESSVLTQVINTARTSTTADTVDCVNTTTTGCLRYFTASNVPNRTFVVLDYLSRLPETYFYNAVN